MADPDGVRDRTAGSGHRPDRDGTRFARVRDARRRLRRQPAPVAAVLVALATGGVVLALATWLFPYHSNNHDEGVYLLQAAMLLEGQLEIHAGDLAASFRPWFFVQDGGRLYPKYAPVPAAIFAVGTALGEPRLSLGLVAVGNVLLCYVLAATAWDRRTGLAATLALVGSPLFLLSSSVFLPYAPTALLNWTFAFAYVHALGCRRLRYAALAGTAIGLAFFARPYTAVLFAAPFVAHALWTLADGALSLDGRAPSREEFASRTAVVGVVAAFGLAGVLVTLLYNRAVTGSALLFPYEAFAPLDGLGFGRREILDHSVEYTPALAARANAAVLWYLGTRWTGLGPLGVSLAAIGLAVHARGERPTDPARVDGPTLRWLLVGVVASVVVGNVYFWGNYNALATISDPTDGLVALFGPFYHFDLLLPASGFVAAGALALFDRVSRLLSTESGPGEPRTAIRDSGIRETLVPDSSGGISGSLPTRRRIVRLLLVALVLLALPVGVAVQASVLGPPIERNAAHTAVYEDAYAPFEDDLEDALVFVPTPYGDWLQHPFQPLRNDPTLDGETVYALNRDPGANFAVIDAYPDREIHRFTYRGEWTADPNRDLVPKLERLETRAGERLTATTVLGVPPGVQDAQATVMAGNDRVRYDVGDAGTRDEIALEWLLTADRTSVRGEKLTVASGSPPSGNETSGTGTAEEESFGNETSEARVGGDASPSVSVPAEGTVSLLVTLTQFDGSTLTYRFDLAVRQVEGELEVLWPAETRVCLLTTDCGREGTYLPDRPGEHPTAVSVTTELEATDDSRTARADKD